MWAPHCDQSRSFIASHAIMIGYSGVTCVKVHFITYEHFFKIQNADGKCSDTPTVSLLFPSTPADENFFRVKAYAYVAQGYPDLCVPSNMLSLFKNRDTIRTHA